MTWVKHDNQYLHHPKSTKKQTETRKNVSQWMEEDSRVKTERNRVDK